jgi:PIN domain nuclease of toxin-antitoxin system
MQQQFLLDTVTIVRYFSGQGKIGKKAALMLETLEETDNSLLISVISLMEIMYLAEKNRININLQETLDMIESSAKYSIIDLTPKILTIAETINFYELHDRLILATAKWLEIKIISSDSKFSQVEGIEVIWN